MDHFVHERGLCETTDVGAGTRIWAFAHVLPGARLGADCNICDHVFIENDVVVGDRVTVKCGVQLWDGVRLGNDVFVGPNVTFTNDRFPRSKVYPETFAQTVVQDGASLGANSTILPGLTIGRDALIGAGTVVTKDVPPNAIVVGNPGRIVGYAGADAPRPLAAASSTPETADPSTGFRLQRLRKAIDMRGSLVATEFGDLPFVPQRAFLVFDVPSKEVRGEHAHRACEQFLVCVSGSVNVLADDGTNRQEFVLDDPSIGIHLKAMTWGTQYKYSPGTVLMVFASLPYDDADYIRDYEEFRELVSS
ncbi:WxcM-like domain-containing protein [Modestobacter versicolor]|uniref:WxcM-like domain-containing protein n=1 Tax=Modestobacter versicolor TaxID=429133 RepID=UPI0034DEEA24